MIKKTLLNLSLIIGLMSSGTCWLLANPVKIHRKSLALEIENKRKKAEEKKRQEQAIEYRKLEDEKRKTKNYNRLLAYQQQITKMKRFISVYVGRHMLCKRHKQEHQRNDRGGN